jgi:5S rRNA maturation endonuclease (ribonuclease M5)
MVNWKAIKPSQIAKFCKQQYERYKTYPSVRDIFYHFVDKLWPNTKSVYKQLSKWLVKMRLKGKVDWRIIRDGAGREYEEGDSDHVSPREHVLGFYEIFTDIGSRYWLPKWEHQPKKVIVACEKEADYPVVKAILKGWNVDTFYERGYSGWRPLFEAVEKVRAEKKQAVVLALGDFDPSGEDIVKFLGRAFQELGLQDIIMEKVSVTKDQIEAFKLPHRPEDAEEIKKLQKDPRFKKWPWGLYRVETAALRDQAPDYFDTILRAFVRKHYDEGIWQREVEPRQAAGRRKIRQFFDEQSDVIDDLKANIEESGTLEED